MRIDNIDREILSILLRAAATSKAEIARRVGLAASAVSERMRRYEEDGIVEGYEARLNGRALGMPLLAYVFVRELKPNSGIDTAKALSRVTGVEEVHKIAGEDCSLSKYAPRELKNLARCWTQRLMPSRPSPAFEPPLC
jgi:Lrp/AsnC family leucine-responsive transcriptional regulator